MNIKYPTPTEEPLTFGDLTPGTVFMYNSRRHAERVTAGIIYMKTNRNGAVSLQSGCVYDAEYCNPSLLVSLLPGAYVVGED